MIRKISGQIKHGARVIGLILNLSKGSYRHSRHVWGLWFWPLLLAGPLLMAVNFYLHPLLWGHLSLPEHLGNPFEMDFPIQAGEMATVLITSPLYLIPLFVSYWLGRVRWYEPFCDRSALLLPVLWSAFLTVCTLETLYLYQEVSGFALDSQFLPLWTGLFHFFGNLVQLGAWMTLFLLVSIRSPAVGTGLIIAVFFGAQSLLMVRGFIPHFGILDFLDTYLMDFSHHEVGTAAMVRTALSMGLSLMLIFILWALLHQNLEKLDKETVARDDWRPHYY